MKTLFRVARIQVRIASQPIVRTKMPVPMPLARIAVTSLSAARRLRPIRMPTSTAMGMVTVRALGIVRKISSATLGIGALLRTTSSRIRVTSRMNRTNVNTAPPMTACERTSRRM